MLVLKHDLHSQVRLASVFAEDWVWTVLTRCVKGFLLGSEVAQSDK